MLSDFVVSDSNYKCEYDDWNHCIVSPAGDNISREKSDDGVNHRRHLSRLRLGIQRIVESTSDAKSDSCRKRQNTCSKGVK